MLAPWCPARCCCRRVRPFSDKEKVEGVDEAFVFPDAGARGGGGGEEVGGRLITTVGLPPAVPNKQYEFDKVFGPGVGQEETYMAVQPLIQSVMDGFNVCVFAYGQTGSGKTFTMEVCPKTPRSNQNTQCHPPPPPHTHTPLNAK